MRERMVASSSDISVADESRADAKVLSACAIRTFSLYSRHVLHEGLWGI
jgi:hypothetical protein